MRRSRTGSAARVADSDSATPWTSACASEPGEVKLALYPRKALAKQVGVAEAGSGSHRLVVGGVATPPAV